MMYPYQARKKLRSKLNIPALSVSNDAVGPLLSLPKRR